MMVLVAAMITFLLGLKRFQWAVLWYVFCIPLFPRSISLAIGGGALTQARLGVVVLVILFLAYFLLDQNIRKKTLGLLSRFTFFFVVLIALLLLKLFSTAINSGVSSLFYMVDEILFSIFIVFSVYVSLRRTGDERKFITVFILGVFLSGMISVAEQAKGSPILKGLVEAEVEVSDKALEGRERDGRFRSQALYDNPLLLSEFTNLILPFIIFGVIYFRKKIKILAVLGLIFVPFILWAVDSRSGFAIGLLGTMFFCTALLWSKSNRFIKVNLIATLLIFGTMAGYFSYNLLSNPEVYFQREDSGGVSALERVSQYIIVGNAVQKSPIIGFGLTQNFAKDLDFLNHLDNYWLRLLLEGGIPSFLLFSLLTLQALKLSIRGLSNQNTKEGRYYYAAIVTFFCVFILNKLFLSMPINNVYFFIVCALLFWRLDFDRRYKISIVRLSGYANPSNTQ